MRAASNHDKTPDLAEAANRRRELALLGLLLLGAAFLFGWGIGSYPLWVLVGGSSA